MEGFSSVRLWSDRVESSEVMEELWAVKLLQKQQNKSDLEIGMIFCLNYPTQIPNTSDIVSMLNILSRQ